MKSRAKKDIAIIMSISLLFTAVYLIGGDAIMNYGRNLSNPLLLRFIPVLFIQFGMSCLGILIVLIRNKETLSDHGLVKRNVLFSVIGCLAVSIPTVIFLGLSDNIHGFLPFQGMFLTDDILKYAFPLNILGYLVIALVWGLGEGLFYVVLADKINTLKKPAKLRNPGAFFCAMIAIAIHGMIGYDMIPTFILMYGSLVIREKTGNAWGNILIFFVIWNAL